MTKMVVSDPKQGKVLLDKLQFEKLKLHAENSAMSDLDTIHGIFHYEVCKWLQKEGYETI